MNIAEVNKKEARCSGAMMSNIMIIRWSLDKRALTVPTVLMGSEKNFGQSSLRLNKNNKSNSYSWTPVLTKKRLNFMQRHTYDKGKEKRREEIEASISFFNQEKVIERRAYFTKC